MPDYWIDHIHLMSPDPEKTAEFYVEMFSARQVSKHELGNGRVTVNLDMNGTTILISQQAADSAQTGLGHFGIGTDNLDKAVDDLKARGVEFTMDKREIRSGFKISFLTAPENVSIELQEGGF
jgi:catechol 2,3-dioxygenase-like lactoylglutathione lyase family enzyme